MRNFSAFAAAAVMLAVAPSIGLAQESAPEGLAIIEASRSRACVPVLKALEDLNSQLEPLGSRSERMVEIATAIAIEDRSFADSLNVDDSTEAEVRDWFIADGRLAQSFLASQEPSVQRQRQIDRERIKGFIQAVVDSIQTTAQTLIDDAGDLGDQADSCDGAILIRSAVLEACAAETSAICTAAQANEPDEPYRFVETADDLWDINELRPWTAPTPLGVSPEGQLDGARSVVFTRQGNVVFSVAFSPLIRRRSEMLPDELQDLQTILDSLGLAFDHPDLIYAPSLAIRATLPQPLAGEDQYVIHFGGVDAAEVLWAGEAGTGANIELPIVLTATHVMMLQRGAPLQLTAMGPVEGGGSEPLYVVELTAVNQANATQALLRYMAGAMVEDLIRLVPPGA